MTEENREIDVRIYEEGELAEQQSHYIEPDTDISEKGREIEEVFKQSTDLPVLAHRLWTHWSQHIAEEEDISQERLDRWKGLWVPFNELSEEMQEKDRELVDRFLDEEPDYDKDTVEGGS